MVQRQAAAWVLVALPAIATAGTDTATFGVSLEVIPECEFESVTSIEFSDGICERGETATGSIALTNPCSEETWCVALDDGMNPDDGDTGFRQMTDGTCFVKYAITKPGAPGDEWGDSDFDDAYPLGSAVCMPVGSGTSLTITANIQDDCLCEVPYSVSDTVTATLYFGPDVP